MREIDPKDLVPVKWEDLVEHLLDRKESGRAVVYRKTGEVYEQVVLQIGTEWYPNYTKKLIAEGRLFKRRNKYFQSFQA